MIHEIVLYMYITGISSSSFLLFLIRKQNLSIVDEYMYVYVVVQFYPQFSFDFPLFDIHYHILV